ncbi:deoxyguanosinetriphosphate triphosphohydrolase [Helicovermis profundi]|uniref:Deoxyguanosinetriphosphate triphosphohydrolase-like protein n=1 Tax=Helicovermis profundi TaxID=3065157 RepID=A0AAU9E4W3_9FIRM|nr:deoxyguanosinetriphosphate triphosphohydrolase [Clostridia bacterium S502]
MTIREETYKIERMILQKNATLSENSRGRQKEEALCEFRTPFQRDRDRIIHSKAFRRLKHKTQVFLSPEGDHYRTRLTHTLEVSQISRTIARALRLNEDLVEAIALGHDLGHTPFGHCGEMELNKIHKEGFRHNEQSLRIVDYLEMRSGKRRGINLTYEVRDGILNHRGENLPSTLEGKIVRISDRIAYVNHDIDDAIRANVLSYDIFPKEYFEVLGQTHSKRINKLIHDIVETSLITGDIKFSEETSYYFNMLRDFMFEKVYLNIKAKKDEEKAMNLINKLYYYFVNHPEKLPDEFFKEYKELKNIAIKDYVSGMTDRYAISKYKSIFIPEFWI